MRPIPGFPLSRRRRLWLALIGVLIGILIGLAMVSAQLWRDWNYLGLLKPYGGRYFFKTVVLAVPSYRQNDERWGDVPLGPTEGTLGEEGCAVASAAMVLGFYGIDTDPKRLNEFLSINGGYTPQGWIYWESAAEFTPGRIRHAYEDLPSYRLIDSNLAKRNPVIVRLRLASGTTHFVVIVGKAGFEYLIRDPGAGADRGLYPLRELGSQVEALRFYEKL